MVGQLPLEQPIGVRIPGGQPNKAKHLPNLAPSQSLCRSIRSGNMPVSAAIRKDVRENCPGDGKLLYGIQTGETEADKGRATLFSSTA
jgi:hypothetical protein